MRKPATWLSVVLVTAGCGAAPSPVAVAVPSLSASEQPEAPLSITTLVGPDAVAAFQMDFVQLRTAGFESTIRQLAHTTLGDYFENVADLFERVQRTQIAMREVSCHGASCVTAAPFAFHATLSEAEKSRVARGLLREPRAIVGGYADDRRSLLELGDGTYLFGRIGAAQSNGRYEWDNGPAITGWFRRCAATATIFDAFAGEASDSAELSLVVIDEERAEFELGFATEDPDELFAASGALLDAWKARLRHLPVFLLADLRDVFDDVHIERSGEDVRWKATLTTRQLRVIWVMVMHAVPTSTGLEQGIPAG